MSRPPKTVLLVFGRGIVLTASLSAALLDLAHRFLWQKRSEDGRYAQANDGEEKIGQLSQVFAFGSGASMEKRIRDSQLGSVLFVTDAAPINNCNMPQLRARAFTSRFFSDLTLSTASARFSRSP
jgi:hypothetical protein